MVWFPPGEKHWHGATPTTAMTHIAIQEALDGKTVDWMEKVSDEQYARLISELLKENDDAEAQTRQRAASKSRRSGSAAWA